MRSVLSVPNRLSRSAAVHSRPGHRGGIAKGIHPVCPLDTHTPTALAQKMPRRVGITLLNSVLNQAHYGNSNEISAARHETAPIQYQRQSRKRVV